jgi:septal ring factor EnvC (AmiA/AmiB activator)
MDESTIERAWNAFLSAPVPLLLTAASLVGAAWWLRSFIAKERLATLEERLRLAHDEQTKVAKEAERLKEEISALAKQIASQTLPDTAAQISAEIAALRASLPRPIHDAEQTLGRLERANNLAMGHSAWPTERPARTPRRYE